MLERLAAAPEHVVAVAAAAARRQVGWVGRQTLPKIIYIAESLATLAGLF